MGNLIDEYLKIGFDGKGGIDGPNICSSPIYKTDVGRIRKVVLRFNLFSFYDFFSSISDLISTLIIRLMRSMCGRVFSTMALDSVVLFGYVFSKSRAPPKKYKNSLQKILNEMRSWASSLGQGNGKMMSNSFVGGGQ